MVCQFSKCHETIPKRRQASSAAKAGKVVVSALCAGLIEPQARCYTKFALALFGEARLLASRFKKTIPTIPAREDVRPTGLYHQFAIHHGSGLRACTHEQAAGSRHHWHAGKRAATVEAGISACQ
jgi:hypothetical protein